MKLHINKKLIPGSESVFIKGSKNGILMLHGLGSTPNEFKEYVEKLDLEGYSINAPLLKGHGTAPEELQMVTWQDWFENSKKALFELRKTCDKIIVIGQSIGATLSVHLAAHYQIEAVVLLSPAFFPNSKYMLRKQYFIKNLYELAVKEPAAKEHVIIYKKTPLRTIKQLLDLAKHVTDDLSDVYTPTLIFHSEEDPLFEYKNAEFVYEKIAAKSKKLLALKNSYNILSMDFEKDIVYKEIAKFAVKVFNNAVKNKGA